MTIAFLACSIVLTVFAIVKINRAERDLRDIEQTHKAFQKWMDDEKTDS